MTINYNELIEALESYPVKPSSSDVRLKWFYEIALHIPNLLQIVREHEKIHCDTGGGCSVCGEKDKPVINVEGLYWLCGPCISSYHDDLNGAERVSREQIEQQQALIKELQQNQCVLNRYMCDAREKALKPLEVWANKQESLIKMLVEVLNPGEKPPCDCVVFEPKTVSSPDYWRYECDCKNYDDSDEAQVLTDRIQH